MSRMLAMSDDTTTASSEAELNLNSSLLVGSLDTSLVQDMEGFAQNNHWFNQDLSNWNTSAVENMSSMFNNAPLFNQDLSIGILQLSKI